MGAREFLRARLEEEYATYFGLPPAAFFDGVIDAWMDDDHNSLHRFEAIERHLPGARRVLDLASGCGSAVFLGLKRGYDMHGVDPERWKHTFNAMKATELGYPEDWPGRMREAIGEALPYDDDSFDCVTTYQTLEHVQDLGKVVAEMLRVTRPGGGLHIRCPDYRGTFEGHYRVPWAPLFPRPLARMYLRALGKPAKGLDTIGYVTKGRVLRALDDARTPRTRLRIVDADREELGPIARRVPGALPLRWGQRFARSLFRREMNVDLFVHVIAK